MTTVDYEKLAASSQVMGYLIWYSRVARGLRLHSWKPSKKRSQKALSRRSARGTWLAHGGHSDCCAAASNVGLSQLGAISAILCYLDQRRPVICDASHAGSHAVGRDCSEEDSSRAGTPYFSPDIIFCYQFSRTGNFRHHCGSSHGDVDASYNFAALSLGHSEIIS